MLGGGTRTFLDPDEYEASLRQAQINLLITPHGEFDARLTWAELHHLRLFYCEEAFPRIAYMCAPPHLVFVTFPRSGPMPVWDGMQMQAGDVILHGRGQRLHQATLGLCGWSVLAANPAQLDNSYRALTGKSLVVPAGGRVLQPSKQNAARLRRLHAQACRLAETQPRMLAHAQVARAIEQGLLHSLVNCLAGVRVRQDAIPRPCYSQIMVRLEEVLAKQDHILRARDLYELVGVTDRTLRSCCDKFLGVSPTRYLRLRQLKRARIALRDADPLAAEVAEIAVAHGFNEPARFVALYRATFGEPPSATLQRPRPTHFAGPRILLIPHSSP